MTALSICKASARDEACGGIGGLPSRHNYDAQEIKQMHPASRLSPPPRLVLLLSRDSFGEKLINALLSYSGVNYVPGTTHLSGIVLRPRVGRNSCYADNTPLPTSRCSSVTNKPLRLRCPLHKLFTTVV